MSTQVKPRIASHDLARLRVLRTLPNLVKIPLFVALMVALSWLAWSTPYGAWRWFAYIGIGYLWMGMVTFMHDATHDVLFRHRGLGWAFGIVTMIPIFASFIAFREDHLEHHRYNRSPRDPDAFTMGRRGPLDFLLFYAYALGGALLSFVHFNFIYPCKRFKAREWAIHGLETLLKALVYWWVIASAMRHGVLAEVLALWLWPIFFFSLFNSMRFIAEHYGTPWDAGPLAGTRTLLSNPAHAFFWNNINLHIGHHVYPGVPWYNLGHLHDLLKDRIAASGALVDRSYVAVYLDALLHGPESAPRLAARLRLRAARDELHSAARRAR